MKEVSADKFIIKGEKWCRTYVFPFKALDDTPGGKNLGMMHWMIEPIKGKKTKGRYYIEKLLVSAGQTYDKRYYGKIFVIPCYSEMISGFSRYNDNNEEDAIKYCSRIGFCEVHKSAYFYINPRKEHSSLTINLSSSIMIDIFLS